MGSLLPLCLNLTSKVFLHFYEFKSFLFFCYLIDIETTVKSQSTVGQYLLPLVVYVYRLNDYFPGQSCMLS